MVDCTDAAQGSCQAEQPRGMLEKTERIIRSYISIDSRVSASSKAIHALCKTAPTIPEHLRALLSTRSIHSCVLSKDVPQPNERNSAGLLYTIVVHEQCMRSSPNGRDLHVRGMSGAWSI